MEKTIDQKGKEILQAIGLVMAVVILSVIGALVIESIIDTPIFDDIPTTGTNTNESLGVVTNVTNTTLAIKSTAASATCSLSTVYNSTGGEVLLAGNYTFYSSACNLTLQDASSYIGESLNATYSFSYPSGKSLAGLNATIIGDAFGLFITGLIAFLAIIGTIIGVVWLVFYVKSLFDKKDGIQAMTA